MLELKLDKETIDFNEKSKSLHDEMIKKILHKREWSIKNALDNFYGLGNWDFNSIKGKVHSERIRGERVVTYICEGVPILLEEEPSFVLGEKDGYMYKWNIWV